MSKVIIDHKNIQLSHCLRSNYIISIGRYTLLILLTEFIIQLDPVESYVEGIPPRSVDMDLEDKSRRQEGDLVVRNEWGGGGVMLGYDVIFCY